VKDEKKETVTESEILMTIGSDASSVLQETRRRAHVALNVPRAAAIALFRKDRCSMTIKQCVHVVLMKCYSCDVCSLEWPHQIEGILREVIAIRR